jgi:translation elongation factor EF-1beta
MSTGLIAILIVSIVVVGGLISYLLQRGKDQNDSQPYTPPAYSKEELDNIKLAEELYNKDLRPSTAKVFPDDATINLEQVKPEFVDKVVQTSKVLPPQATINAEALKEVKDIKPEFPIDKLKKKKKYYPKAPKTNI